MKRRQTLSGIRVRPASPEDGSRIIELERELARKAVERGALRLEWAVLPWNEGAIRFYQRFGARRQEEWARYCLEESEIRRLAGSE